MKDAIIILGGAFNPVHTQHIALLCLAKEELEKSGTWNILGGYLAVATDGYVRHKLAS
jgi:nicotinic acid mononucleotide adenylyltransferase